MNKTNNRYREKGNQAMAAVCDQADAANLVLVQKEEIRKKALELL